MVRAWICCHSIHYQHKGHIFCVRWYRNGNSWEMHFFPWLIPIFSMLHDPKESERRKKRFQWKSHLCVLLVYEILNLKCPNVNRAKTAIFSSDSLMVFTLQAAGDSAPCKCVRMKYAFENGPHYYYCWCACGIQQAKWSFCAEGASCVCFVHRRAA